METFGEFIRKLRISKEIGLREMAGKIGVTPTYLSRVERDEDRPPVEDKVRKIAKILGCDVDVVLAKADRVATDLSDIIKREPKEVAALLRSAKGLTTEELAKLVKQANSIKEKQG